MHLAPTAAPAIAPQGGRRATRGRAPVASPPVRRVTRGASPWFVALAALAGAASFALVRTSNAEAPGPDTTRWRLEAGVMSDFTNELFYEDAFVDSISLGRRLVSTPEARTVGVVATTLDGTRGLRATRYTLRAEGSLGDKLQRGAASANWRALLPGDWSVTAAPRAEYRHDRTFDRDLEEARGAITVRARRDALVGLAPEVGLDGDFLRAAGKGADFLPDRNGARVSVALGSGVWAASDWRAGYGLAARSFPDSSDRDHVEHGMDARWRRSIGDATVSVETAGQRRQTGRRVSTSRDNFWDGQAALDLDLRAGPTLAWRLRLAGERLRYDREDSTVYFNYAVLRGRFGPRIDRGAWSVTAGPRAEVLTSRANEAERYTEIGGFVDVEYIGRAFWTVSPAAGRRAYRVDASPDVFSVVAVHSDYTFIELSLLADQPVTGGVRIRAIGAGRYERHAEPADDARSLYFSLDVRRLF